MIPARALSAVTPEELSKAATLFGTLKQLRLRLTNADEAVLDRAFETHVQGVLDKLENRLPALEDTQLQFVEIVMARHGLFDAAFQQAILLCQNSDSLKELRGTHSRFMTDLQQVVGEFVKANKHLELEIKKSQEAHVAIFGECKKLQETITLLDQEADEHQEIISDLRQKLRQSQLDCANLQDILASSSAAVSTAPSVAATKKKTKTASEHKRETLDQMNMAPVTGTFAGSGAKPEALRSSGAGSTSLQRSSGPDSWLYAFRTDLQVAIDEERCRELSLKECREFIDKIYESKALAKGKLAQGVNVPVETLEMHMYRVLEKKYGLRNIAVDHASMALQAIDKYASEDNFVSVFHKAFRNEVEEDFWQVQKELTRSIRDLTLVHLMGRLPTKDQATLHAMLDQKLEGIIMEEEWNDMVSYLYNSSDSTAICLILKRLAREHMIEEGLLSAEDLSASMGSLQLGSSGSSASGGGASGAGGGASSKSTAASGFQRSSSAGRRVPSRGYTAFLNTSVDSADSKHRGKQQLGGGTTPSRRGRSSSSFASKGQSPSKIPLRLPFQTFLKCVLDFQLRSHMQYLSNFRTAFQRCDLDADGILSAEEFHACFQSLRKGQFARFESNSSNTSRGPSQSQSQSQAQGRGQLQASPESKEDEETFQTLLEIVDPFETDRITFSCAASILNKVANVSV